MMMEEKLQMFRNRLAKMYKHVSKLAKRQEISCYRIYDADIPEFPFCVERYEGYIYLAEYKRQHDKSEEEHFLWLDSCKAIIAEVASVPITNIYMRERQRQDHRQGQYEKLDDNRLIFEVGEGGLRFRVNFTDYLDTGLFLDHRITRGMVRNESQGKRMLNLFCYTGSFSVYAAAGQASEVTSVDLSNTYLKWAEENFIANQLLNKKIHHFVQADVKQYLDTLPENYFGLVVMDPPTFSNSKRMKDFLDIQRDHVELINKTLRAMQPGASLYFSTNFRRFKLDEPGINASSIRNITAATTAFDFYGKLARFCFRIIK